MLFDHGFFWCVGGFKEWVDGWAEGWLDGWAEEWVDRWAGLQKLITDLDRFYPYKGGA